MGLTEYNTDGLWKDTSNLKTTYSPALWDALAVATVRDLANDGGRNVTLLIRADDDFNTFEHSEQFNHLPERLRNKSHCHNFEQDN